MYVSTCVLNQLVNARDLSILQQSTMCILHHCHTDKNLVQSHRGLHAASGDAHVYDLEGKGLVKKRRIEQQICSRISEYTGMLREAVHQAAVISWRRADQCGAVS